MPRTRTKQKIDARRSESAVRCRRTARARHVIDEKATLSQPRLKNLPPVRRELQRSKRRYPEDAEPLAIDAQSTWGTSNLDTKHARPPEDLSKEPKSSVLERPHLKISGRRRVPFFVSSSKIPHLRIRKPQPRIISRIIRDKIQLYQKRIDKTRLLETELERAQFEDEWDQRLESASKSSRAARSSRVQQGSGENPWADAPKRAVAEEGFLYRREVERNLRLGEKMATIVIRESELNRKEKAERAAKKRQDRAERLRHSVRQTD